MTRASGHGLSNYEIRRLGWAALTERLGASGAMRFMMQYDPGYGDYAADREQLLADISFAEAVKWIEAHEDRRTDPPE